MTLAGIYPIVPTPFFDDGALDLDSIDRLVDYLVPQGVAGLTVLGALGEGHKLTEGERAAVIARFRRALPDGLTLVVGVRAAADHPAAFQAHQAADLGAQALLVAPPPAAGPPGIQGYFQAVATAAPHLALVIHDYPAETGVKLSPEFIAALHGAPVAAPYIKLEDPPTGLKMDRLAKLAPDLKVFGALGGMYALEELERGAVGIMTGFVFAGLLVRLYQLAQAGDWPAARELFYDFVPLVRWEFQPGIGASLRKRLLKELGVFTSPAVRGPGLHADERSMAQMWHVISHLRDKGYQI